MAAIRREAAELRQRIAGLRSGLAIAAGIARADPEGNAAATAWRNGEDAEDAEDAEDGERLSGAALDAECRRVALLLERFTPLGRAGSPD